MSSYELAHPPSDGISCVRFAHNSNRLLASSWDTNVYLYEAAQNKLLTQTHFDKPVLSCAFDSEDRHFLSGGLDHAVSHTDLETGSTNILGRHHEPVRHVLYNSGLGVSGGWDKQVCLWDCRAVGAAGRCPVEGKVYAMDQSEQYVIVGLDSRKIVILDVRNFSVPLQVREPCLKHQTRCIRAFPNGTPSKGYIVASIEGRVAIEYIDPSPEVQAQKYAFKCHRAQVEGNPVIYPINAVAVHPAYGTFATGGCDGLVHVWDGACRKRVSTLPKHHTSVSSMDFNQDGTRLAIAASYTFEHGPLKQAVKDQICVRQVAPSEVMPKRRQRK